MRRSNGLGLLLAAITACGARGEDGDESASASADTTAQSESSSTTDEGSAGTAGFVPLAIHFPADKVPYCITVGETVNDYVVPGTGDGGPITCAREGGLGGGTLPEGVALDPETCAIEGEPPADRFGTWAVIVKATQGETDVWVPYCVTRDQPPDGDASIEVITAEDPDAALHPLHRTFTADAPLTAGIGGDPLFRVVDPARCGDSCAYSYEFFASASPFVVDEGPFIVDAMIVTDDGDPIGMSHGLELSGPPIGGTAPELAERPWVFALQLDYCLAADAADCDASPPTVAARFRYSVVMSPD